ncbi:MAG: hypothetical protein EBR82_30125 [Caulobacteraceae bacterium]|nr:hypothetical protein [Caulobacteraceae bacterium]
MPVPEDHAYTLAGKRWLIRFTRLRGSAIGWTFLKDERNPNVNERILIDEGTYKKANRAALELLIHEAYHALNPSYDETVVSQHARDLARLLWGLGWRRKE